MENVDPGPSPPDLINQVISVLPPVLFDSAPWGLRFGDCIKQPPASVKTGDTVSVLFVRI